MTQTYTGSIPVAFEYQIPSEIWDMWPKYNQPYSYKFANDPDGNSNWYSLNKNLIYPMTSHDDVTSMILAIYGILNLDPVGNADKINSLTSVLNSKPPYGDYYSLFVSFNGVGSYIGWNSLNDLVLMDFAPFEISGSNYRYRALASITISGTGKFTIRSSYSSGSAYVTQWTKSWMQPFWPLFGTGNTWQMKTDEPFSQCYWLDALNFGAVQFNKDNLSTGQQTLISNSIGSLSDDILEFLGVSSPSEIPEPFISAGFMGDRRQDPPVFKAGDTIFQAGKRDFDLVFTSMFIPCNGNTSNVTYEIVPESGYSSDIQVKYPYSQYSYSSYQSKYDTAFKMNYLTIRIPYNTAVKFYYRIIDANNNVIDTPFWLYCTEDYVDDDGDYIDDETGEYIPPQYSPIYPPSGGGGVSPDFGDFSNMLSNIGSFGTQFIAFFGSIFTFIPVEFTALLLLGLAVVITLRILGR